MNIQSSFEKDIRSDKTVSGAYEWWYFDAVSSDGSTELVIIFYEGNPFSRRYIQQQKNNGKARAEDFPAISISLYQNHQPVYYSFTEVKEEQAVFADTAPYVQIGAHQMAGKRVGSNITYTLMLDEQLPSGDTIWGELIFESQQTTKNLFGYSRDIKSNHYWNVVQPLAQVSGKIRCQARREQARSFSFEGQGYHDHNIGNEPLKNQFDDWHWGRFHFKNTTLIYYVLNGKQQQYGWLIDKNGNRVLKIFDKVRMKDEKRALFGLQSPRKLVLLNNEAEVMIQQTHLLDNGPFYQRFSSNAFLHIPAKSNIESSQGIAEYLCPPRIYNRWHWPLTNMRIRYQKETPHWVQRSKMLYRWTW